MNNVCRGQILIVIIISLTGPNGRNWSELGSMAKTIRDEAQPTMCLNFSNMNDEQIKAIIVHQFGHALGLGHSLMKPRDWKVLKPYLNLEMMTNTLSCNLEDLDVMWTGEGLDEDVVNYDKQSVMQYRFNYADLVQ